MKNLPLRIGVRADDLFIMHTLKHWALVALACAVLAQTLSAWGPEGHRIVATIAFMQLEKPIKDQIVDILGDEDFVEVSNWADQARLSRPNTKDLAFCRHAGHGGDVQRRSRLSGTR